MAQKALDYGEWESAASMAEQALSQEPESPESAELLAAESERAAGNLEETIRILEGTTFPDLASQRKALYLLATAYGDTGDWEQAIEKQTELLGITEELTGWLEELNGDAYVHLDDPGLAVDAYRKAVEASESADIPRLLEKIAKVQVDAKDFEAALKTYDDLLSAVGNANAQARVHYLRGLAVRDAGDETGALEAFTQATETSLAAPESYLALVELLNADVDVDSFRRGLIDYNNATYQAAIDAFADYLDGKQTTRAAEAHYYSGLAYRALGQYDDALASFEDAYDASSDAAFEAQTLMAEGRALQLADRLNEAHSTYGKVPSICATCATAPQALWRSAQIAEQLGDRAAAATDYLWLQRSYPKDGNADDAMLRAAILYYLDERQPEAEQVCEALLAAYPKSDLANAAHFWAAKAEAAASQPEEKIQSHLEAVTPNPAEYYALRAAQWLQGEDVLPTDPANVLLQSDVDRERLEFQNWIVDWANDGDAYPFDQLPEEMVSDPDYRKGELFASLGLADEAATYFSRVRTRWADAPLGLSQLSERLLELRLYASPIACAERVIALSPTASVLDAPRYLQRLAYPVDYADLVLAEASSNRLNPLLLFAVIRQESRFGAQAGSWAGASGLMQVMPPTGEWIALQLRVRDFTPEDLRRPSVNVRFGTWYLGRQLSDFDGNLFAALAAYNGGPGYSRLWLTAFADFDPDVFVESITLSETKNYVKTILAQWAIYRQIYQPAAQ